MMTDAISPAESKPPVSFQHYWHTLLKWKWTALIFFFAVVGATVAISLLIPRSFTSQGTIWVEEQLNILPFEDVQRADSTNSSPQSYSQLLQSRTLAMRVIEKLKLGENPHFTEKLHKGLNNPGLDDKVFLERLIDKFQKSISVRPIERTKLLQVAYSDSDPKFASDTLNTLFDEYIGMIINQRYETSTRAAQFLKGQIASVRTEVEEGEKKLGDYGTAKNILPLTTSETPVVTRLSEVNKALTEATIDRVNKFDYYNQLKAGYIPDNAATTQNTPLQRLRDQHASLSQEYARRLGTLRPEYPEMQRLKSEIDSVRTALDAETKKMTDAAFADYQASLSKEQSLKNLLEQLRTDAFKANSNSIVYNSLRIELENKKALLESLSKRQNETDVSASLKSFDAANIWVVDRADFPLRPTSPNRRKNVLMGLLAGLAGGIGLALGLEYLNNTVKTSKDVTAATGFPTLGVIPAFAVETSPKGPAAELRKIAHILSGDSDSKGRRSGRKQHEKALAPRAHDPNNPNGAVSGNSIELIPARDPQSIQAESYRSIRTTLLVSSPPGKIKAILVTSPLSREGKSATTANLAFTLSQAGKRVVILDADLRKPKQSRIFGLSGGWGLTHFVSSFIDAADLVKPTQFPNLWLITSGPIPANPIELLTSEKVDALMAFLKRSYDYILLDAPPLLAVSDALALGPVIDGIILVARGGQTPIPALKQAKQKLDVHKLKCLGVVINGVNLVEQDGYYAKQYYQYSKAE